MIGRARLGGEVVHLIVQQKPSPSAVTREPKLSFRVVVTATALPSRIDHGVVRRMIRLGHCAGRRMRGGVLFELGEDSGPQQILADAGVRRIDRFPPGRAISFVDQLRDGDFGKIGIAHKLGPIEERAPEGFQGQMHRLRRPAPHLRQIVAFENIQDLDQRRPARRRRRRADDVVSAVGPAHRLPALSLRSCARSSAVIRPPPFCMDGRQFARHRAMIEVVGIVRRSVSACAPDPAA